MMRVLIDYKKLNHEIGALLIDTYPHGYGDDDIIAFKNSKGEIVEAVELKTKDVLYLVKISKSLSNFIANFDDAIEKELEVKPTTEETESSLSDDSVLEINLERELDEEMD
ncbi:hypothetical protein GGR42_000222 [Saonia flava]|uniref:Uncharacterized protein n=1 Tax=Saonia flava TaxID=523696 RepID=A0A846QS11_9FLAO|nr:hypothetical protein [Saonia flava]NJB69760.1 hypothetical protein [Saonia flava]